MTGRDEGAAAEVAVRWSYPWKHLLAATVGDGAARRKVREEGFRVRRSTEYKT